MNKIVLLTCLLLLILIALMVLQVSYGPAGIAMDDIIPAILHPSSDFGIILWRLRIPRMLYGICLGAGLASCGLALQGLFRNPLAEPYTLGISSGAAFGAVLAITLGIQSFLLTSFFALLGAAMVALIVFLLVQIKMISQTALILSGVMIGYFFQSLVMLMVSLSSSARAHGAMMWLLGDISSPDTQLLPVTLLICAFGWFFLYWNSFGLDLVSMGEEKAASMGVDIIHLRRHVFIWASVITGTCVAAMGVVGFVGLIIPHVLRQIAGPRHAVLFPLCAIGGAAFVLLCDLISRWMVAPAELPLGVITGMIGSLTFLWIFIRRTTV